MDPRSAKDIGRGADHRFERFEKILCAADPGGVWPEGVCESRGTFVATASPMSVIVGSDCRVAD